jgi:hypothetical protein
MENSSDEQPMTFDMSLGVPELAFFDKKEYNSLVIFV